MDYIFVLTLLCSAVVSWIVASYDVACQWSKNFWNRMSEYPPSTQLPSTLNIRFLVPKFHLAAHIPQCFAPFSFNFAWGVGRTDGEGVERKWSWLNGIARCTSVMGAGGRWDTLDDFCNFTNWRKVVGFGTVHPCFVHVSWLLRKDSLAKAIAGDSSSNHSLPGLCGVYG